MSYDPFNPFRLSSSFEINNVAGFGSSMFASNDRERQARQERERREAEERARWDAQQAEMRRREEERQRQLEAHRLHMQAMSAADEARRIQAANATAAAHAQAAYRRIKVIESKTTAVQELLTGCHAQIEELSEEQRTLAEVSESEATEHATTMQEIQEANAEIVAQQEATAAELAENNSIKEQLVTQAEEQAARYRQYTTNFSGLMGSILTQLRDAGVSTEALEGQLAALSE